MAMPATQEDTWTQRRKKYGDEQVLNAIIQASGGHKAAWDMRIKKHGATAVLDALLEAQSKPRVVEAPPTPAGETVTPAPSETPDWEKSYREALEAKFYPPEEIEQIVNVAKKWGLPVLPGAEIPERTRAWRPQDTVSGMRVFVEGLKRLPKASAAALLTSLQGGKGASVVAKGWADEFITATHEDTDKAVREAVKRYRNKKFLPGIKITDVAMLPDNIAFSGVSLTGGLATGVPVGLIPGGQAAGVGVGAATAGTLAYKMASYRFMQDILEANDEEMMKHHNRHITKAEEDKLKKEFAWRVRKYGLWEAIPEMVGTGGGAAIVLAPLKKVAGKTIASKLASKVAGIYAGEFATETITQMGQRGLEAEAGLPGAKPVNWKSPSDWLTALKEIAPGTFLLTTLMAGAGVTAVETHRAMANRAVKNLEAEIGEDHPAFNDFKTKLEEFSDADAEVATALAEQIKEGRGRMLTEEERARAATVPPAEITPAVPDQRAIEAGVSRTATKVGLSEDDVLFMRSMGLDDTQIQRRVMFESPLIVGERVGIPKWKAEGRVVDKSGDTVTVQFGNGMKATVARDDIISLSDVTVPPEEITSVPPAVRAGMIVKPELLSDEAMARLYAKAEGPRTAQEIEAARKQFVEKQEKRPEIIAPITKAEVAPVVEEVSPSVRASLLAERGVIPDEELARMYAEATSKPERVKAAIKKHGATTVVDEVEKATVAPPTEESLFGELDDWRRKRTQWLREKIKEEDGFFRLFPGFKGREIAESEIEDRAIRDAARASRDLVKGTTFASWSKNAAKSIVEKLAGTFEPELKDAGEIQFRDDVRTGPLTIISRARHNVSYDFDLIWGDRVLVSNEELYESIRQATNKPPELLQNKHRALRSHLGERRRHNVLDILFLQDALESIQKGLSLPDNIHEKTTTLPDGTEVPTVQVELERLLSTATQGELDALENYHQYTRTVAQILVRRGKMSPDAVKNFYLPHVILDYKPEWFESTPFLPRRAREAFRMYTKQRRGSTKRYSVDEGTLYSVFATIEADNLLDDWVIGADGVMAKYDIFPNMTQEQKIAVFGETGRPRPGGRYEIGDKIYRGYQYDPGRIQYRQYIVDIKNLMFAIEQMTVVDNDALIKILKMPEELQYDAIMDYLSDIGPRGGAALRIGRVIGPYKKTFVIPEAIYEKMIHFKDGTGNIPGLYEVGRLMRKFKGLALGPWGGGLPFQERNMRTDFAAAFMTDVKAVHPRHIRTAWNIIRNYRPEKRADLTERERRVLDIAERKAVMDSGFRFEYTAIQPMDSVSGFNRKYMRLSGAREALLRIAMVSRQLELVESGQEVNAPQFKHITSRLDTESAIGFIAREFGADYHAVPEWYRRIVSGFGFPFATWYSKMGRNVLWYIRNAPAKAGGKILGPIIGTWAWNNGPMREAEEKLPPWQRQIFHINLPWGIQRDENGNMTKVLWWSWDLPHSVISQMLGLNTLGNTITMMREGTITEEEAAKWILTDMGIEGGKFFASLVNPAVNMAYGLKANKNFFTNQPIVPPELEGLPNVDKLRYWTPFVLESLIVPYAQFAKRLGEEDRLFAVLPDPKEMPSAIDNYTRKGILDVWRGMGFRWSDLRTGEAYDIQYSAMLARGNYQKSLSQLVSAYVKSDGDIGKFLNSRETLRAIQNSRERNTPLVEKDIEKVLTQPWVQLELVRRLLNKAKTKEERESLEDQKVVLKDFIIKRRALRLPAQAMPAFLERVGRMQAKKK